MDSAAIRRALAPYIAQFGSLTPERVSSAAAFAAKKLGFGFEAERIEKLLQKELAASQTGEGLRWATQNSMEGGDFSPQTLESSSTAALDADSEVSMTVSDVIGGKRINSPEVARLIAETPLYKLPPLIEPSHYDVEVDVSPQRDQVPGKASITATTQLDTDAFMLNAREVEVGKVQITTQSGALIEGKAESHPKRPETMVFTFEKNLPKGEQFNIAFDFKAKVHTNMRALYRAGKGEEAALVTQCQATDARGIFPCYDEPAAKATFAWKVIADPEFTVVANGPLKLKRDVQAGEGARTVYYFDSTRSMSSYLLALTVGHYDASEPEEVVPGVMSRVLAPKGMLSQAEFAAEVTRNVVPWYEEYFGQAFPFAKLDQIAVKEFDAGAMENVGLILYRMSAMLLDKENASWAAKKRVAEVVAHELAHQWFGNLVTMEWWDDLWLNEAFATWMAYKVIDHFYPELRMWDDYLGAKEEALWEDSLVNTHPIYTPIGGSGRGRRGF